MAPYFFYFLRRICPIDLAIGVRYELDLINSAGLFLGFKPKQHKRGQPKTAGLTFRILAALILVLVGLLQQRIARRMTAG